jgi:hypothetical protein
MARRQQPAPLELVPFVVSTPGPVMRTVYVRRGDELLLRDIILDALAQGRAEGRAELAASSQRKRAITSERFERGLILVAWIDGIHGGALTKELVREIKNNCHDWPCVRAYREHKSLEKLRNALRALADDTRNAIRERRLPPGWRFPSVTGATSGPP